MSTLNIKSLFILVPLMRLLVFLILGNGRKTQNIFINEATFSTRRLSTCFSRVFRILILNTRNATILNARPFDLEGSQVSLRSLLILNTQSLNYKQYCKIKKPIILLIIACKGLYVSLTTYWPNLYMKYKV